MQRLCAGLVVACVAILPALPPAAAHRRDDAEPSAQSPQAAVLGLKIVVIEGEDAVNIIQQKTATAPVVEVRDRNDLPVAGIPVTFTMTGGNTAAFAGGAQTLTVTTTAAGRAVATGFTPLSSGTVHINVAATVQGQTAAATITQTNFATAAQAAQAGAAPGAGGSAGGTGFPALTVAGIGAAATAAGVVVAKTVGHNAPPAVAGVLATPNVALLGTNTAIVFSADSSDPDGESLGYRWEFGDGNISTEASPRHVYGSAGTFTVRVNVSDGEDTVTGETQVSIRSLSARWYDAGGQFYLALTQNGTTLGGIVHFVFSAQSGQPPVDCPVEGSVRSASPQIEVLQPGCQVGNRFDPGTLWRFDPSPDVNTLTGTWTDLNPLNPIPTVPFSVVRQQ